MSPVMTPAERVAAYRRWGIRVVEVTRNGQSWRGRGRPGTFGGMHGQLAHHTGPYGTVEGMLAMLWDGRSDLPGPLCQDGIAPDGRLYAISGGRANHAGPGAANVRDALVAGRALPDPGPDSVDGNALLYGREVLNPGDGKTPYPNVQVETLIRAQAAVAEHHGWDGRSVARHGGWTRRKPDTAGTTEHGDRMTQGFLQDETDRALRAGPAAYAYPARPVPAAGPDLVLMGAADMAAQIVQVAAGEPIYIVTAGGTRKVKNLTELGILRDAGLATKDTRRVTKAELAALLEQE